MPIKFRCQHCQQLLGISKSQADAVVDCPRCGRTLRVPGLAGNVQPLPAAGVNGDRDSALQSALSELSALQSIASPAEPATSAGTHRNPNGGSAKAEPVVEKSARTVERQPLATVPDQFASLSATANTSAAPVQSSMATMSSESAVVDRMDSATVTVPDSAEAEFSFSDSTALNTTSSNTASSNEALSGGIVAAKPDLRELQAPLRELAVLGSESTADPIRTDPPSSLQSATRRRRLWLMVAGILLFGNGFLIGRGLFDTAAEAPPADASEAGAVANPAAAEVAIAHVLDGPTLRGQVLYADNAGPMQPDSGALVLQLPDPRPGSVKFDGGMLWRPESSADRRAVQAALRQLQADVTVADAEGRFAVTGSETSSRLVVISKHRSRDQDLDPPNAIVELLRMWFDSVPHLTGRLLVQEVTVEDAAAAIEVRFP